MIKFSSNYIGNQHWDVHLGRRVHGLTKRGNEALKKTLICCKMRESCVYVHNIILCVESKSN